MGVWGWEDRVNGPRVRTYPRWFLSWPWRERGGARVNPVSPRRLKDVLAAQRSR